MIALMDKLDDIVTKAIETKKKIEVVFVWYKPPIDTKKRKISSSQVVKVMKVKTVPSTVVVPKIVPTKTSPSTPQQSVGFEV